MTNPIPVITQTTDSKMKEEIPLTPSNDRNRRLFVGSLPKDKTSNDVQQVMVELVQGVVDVIMYASQQDRSRNRGYAFVEFETHQQAATARQQLQAKPPKLWGGAEIKVDWAEPENEVDDETMSKVRVLNL